MLIRYDKEIDAKYITLLTKRQKKGVVSRTQKVYSWLLVDYDVKGNIFGVEVLDASQHRGTIIILDNRVFFLEGSFQSRKTLGTSDQAHEEDKSLSLDSYSLANA